MASNKTASAAAKLVAKTKATPKKNSDEIRSDKHVAVVDELLQLRVGSVTLVNRVGILENEVKLAGRALYDEAKGSNTSVIMAGTDTELKVVVKSSFSNIDIQHRELLETIFAEQAEAEGAEDVPRRAQELFDEHFEISRSVKFVTPSDAQLVYIDRALKIVEILTEAEDPEAEISEIARSEARALRRLKKDGAAISYETIFQTVETIVVKPEMAQRQFEDLDPRIKALLKQTAPSITVAPKTLEKIDRAAAAKVVAKLFK